MGGLCAKCIESDREEGFEHINNFEREYEFGELLGMGSFGAVYKTRKNGQILAVKVIKTVYSSASGLDIQREARLLHMVKGHPHIVEICDIIESSHNLLIYMEYCDKGNLIEYMKRKRPFLDEMIIYLAQLVDAVKYVHSKRVIHRDIKPANALMKTECGSVVLKLADFGIGNVAATLGFFDTRVGTPEFIAPEILSGKQYTFSADVFSVGVVFRKIMECYRSSDKQKSILKMAGKMTVKTPRKRATLEQAMEKLNKRMRESELTPLV